MGTRSITTVKNAKGYTFVRLYRQYDGYLEGHGQELLDFVNGFTIVNGLSSNKSEEKIANGAGCFAAQLIAHFKTEPGQFYILSNNDDEMLEEYNYTVIVNEADGTIDVTVTNWENTLLNFPQA